MKGVGGERVVNGDAGWTEEERAPGDTSPCSGEFENRIIHICDSFSFRSPGLKVCEVVGLLEVKPGLGLPSCLKPTPSNLSRGGRSLQRD